MSGDEQPSVEEVTKTLTALLLENPVDLDKLRALSWQRGGFQTHELRCKAWPKLLGVDRHDLEDHRGYLKQQKDHPQTDQIGRDIDRALTHFSHTRRWKRPHREARRLHLAAVIKCVVCKHKDKLFYYQGYHDVISVLLLILREEGLTFALAERLSLTYLRDSMRSDFHALTLVLQILPVIIHHFDKDLSVFIKRSSVEPFYALPWVITWFAHDLPEMDCVARLYDALLGSHPLTCLYLSAALVLSKGSEVMQQECEFSAVHNALAHLPVSVDGSGWEGLLQDTCGLMDAFPPHKLVKKLDGPLRRELEAMECAYLVHPPAEWFQASVAPDHQLLGEKRSRQGKPATKRSKRTRALDKEMQAAEAAALHYGRNYQHRALGGTARASAPWMTEDQSGFGSLFGGFGGSFGGDFGDGFKRKAWLLTTAAGVAVAAVSVALSLSALPGDATV